MGRLLAGQGVERTDVAKQGNGTLAMTGATQSLVVANKDRVALYVTAPAAAISLALGAGPAVAANGLTIPPNTVVKIDGYSGAVQIIGTAAQVVSFAEI